MPAGPSRPRPPPRRCLSSVHLVWIRFRAIHYSYLVKRRLRDLVRQFLRWWKGRNCLRSGPLPLPPPPSPLAAVWLPNASPFARPKLIFGRSGWCRCGANTVHCKPRPAPRCSASRCSLVVKRDTPPHAHLPNFTGYAV